MKLQITSGSVTKQYDLTTGQPNAPYLQLEKSGFQNYFLPLTDNLMESGDSSPWLSFTNSTGTELFPNLNY